MKLPASAKVNKFIPKTQFYSRTAIGNKVKEEFTSQIQKIIWAYKLAENTINIQATERVEEIQIFEIELKSKITPKNILQIIDKNIPYPILFILKFGDDKQYAISLKEKNIINGYYFSDWKEKMDFDFTGTTLEKVYQKIIRKFIKSIDQENKSFGDIIETDSKIKNLQEDIKKLEEKLRKEKQFNREVDINKELTRKKQLLNKII
jgi:hypothetical protein